MIWILAIIVVAVIYNAERMPQIIEKIKGEAPHIVEAGKKMSKEIKEKATSNKATKKQEKTENE
ncbi:MAG: hypothetical protein IKW58_02530 [Alphaproteobacteria bacterium]|nr:hypothetical protein [Alphaproteobacteria bacterium]